MSSDLFAHDYARAARDRARIVAHARNYLRTGVAAADLVLEYGPRVRLDRGRTLLDQYAWKWSEVRGKYVGCSYWSSAARKALELWRKGCPRMSLTALCEFAKKKVHPDSQRIVHEHVFPRRSWVALYEGRVGNGDDVVESVLIDDLDRCCIGCIVTGAEDREVVRRPVSATNPWLRYSGTSIRLVDNPGWAEQQRRWIVEAGLLET